MHHHCVLLPAFRGPLLVLMLMRTDGVPLESSAGSGSGEVGPEVLQAIVEVRCPFLHFKAIVKPL
jgi:hypothetical protein